MDLKRYTFPLSCALLMGASNSFGVFTSVANFENQTLGSSVVDDAAWNGNNTSIVVGTDPVTGSQAARIAAGTPSSPIYISLGTNVIADQSVGTLFFSFSLAETSDAADLGINIGTGIAAGSVNTFGDQGAYPVFKGDEVTARDGSGDASPFYSGFEAGVSYNTWVVIDNQAGTGSDTYDIYIQGGSGSYAVQTLLYNDIAVRGQTAADYTSVFIYPYSSDASVTISDDIYLDNYFIDPAGQNLTTAIPETSTYVLILGSAALILAVGRKRLSAPRP